MMPNLSPHTPQAKPTKYNLSYPDIFRVGVYARGRGGSLSLYIYNIHFFSTPKTKGWVT